MGMIRLQKVWQWGLMKIWLLKSKKDHHLSKVRSLNQLFLMWKGVQSPPWISASINITIFYAGWWEHHGTNWWNGIGVKGYSHQRDWPWSNKGHLEIVEGYDKKIQTFYFYVVWDAYSIFCHSTTLDKGWLQTFIHSRGHWSLFRLYYNCEIYQQVDWVTSNIK